VTEWLLCVAVVVASILLMPAAIRYARRSRRLRGGGAAIGGALTGFYDPARKVALERIERQREIGGQEDEASGGRSG